MQQRQDRVEAQILISLPLSSAGCYRDFGIGSAAELCSLTYFLTFRENVSLCFLSKCF